MLNESDLAINGGLKIRERPMPPRVLFGVQEMEAVISVFQDSWTRGRDFSYQWKFEERYTDKFCEIQGGGYADAVCSGTVAVYLALLALDLPLGSDVIVSPVTDPGSISPVIIAGMNPIVADSEPNSFNVGPDEFEKALTPNTRAANLTHLGGYPCDMDPILEIARARDIKIIEDCSQTHGALYKGKRVGTFGDIAAFSTMYRKSHATGGCGGIVYTRDEDLYWRARSLADRGKPFNTPNFNPKNPAKFLFPALNLNLDELSCAIGLSTLSHLQETIDKRFVIIQKIDAALAASSVVFPCCHPPDCIPSIYFHTVEIAVDKLKVSKREFAEAVAAEGISVNPHYQNSVSEWDWVGSKTQTPNAGNFRDRTFNILVTEKYMDRDIRDIIASILKVESVYARS